MNRAEPRTEPGRVRLWLAEHRRALAVAGVVLAVHVAAGPAWSIPVTLTVLVWRFRHERAVRPLLAAVALVWAFTLWQPTSAALGTEPGQAALGVAGDMLPPVPWGWLKAVGLVVLAGWFIGRMRRSRASARGGRR